MGYNDAGVGDARKLINETLPASLEENQNIPEQKSERDDEYESDCSKNTDALRKTTVINTFGAGRMDILSIGVNRRIVERLD